MREKQKSLPSTSLANGCHHFFGYPLPYLGSLHRSINSTDFICLQQSHNHLLWMITKWWWQNYGDKTHDPTIQTNKQKHTKLNTKTHPMQQKLHLPTANRSHLHFQLFSSMLDFFGQCLLSNTKRPAKAQQWPVPKEAGGRSGPCENPFTAVGCVSKSSSIRCVESGETPLDPNDPWKNEGFTPPSYGL